MITVIIIIIIIIKTRIIKINNNNKKKNNNSKLIRKSISYTDYPLLEGWKKSLPKEDHTRVSEPLFKQSTIKDKAELNMSKINKLWWYLRQPSLRVHQRPTVNTYFTRHLLLWMQRKLWQVRLHCPHDDHVKHPLTSAGLYPHVRQVLDLDGFYSLATEYLECGKCKRKVISWSQGILDKLDVGHRKQFPVIITYNYACDVRVLRLLRQRGFGNSSTQLQKKQTEQHKEQWLQRTAHYLIDCQTFVEASKRQLVLAPELDEPPSLPTLPKAGWLLTVYCRDVLSRLEEVKPYITSTFGSVLKIDSTKVKYYKQINYQVTLSLYINSNLLFGNTDIS